MLQEVTIGEIQKLIENSWKPDIADLIFHFQSMERSVKLVSEACQISYGLERCHKIIKLFLPVTKLKITTNVCIYNCKGHYQITVINRNNKLILCLILLFLLFIYK